MLGCTSERAFPSSQRTLNHCRTDAIGWYFIRRSKTPLERHLSKSHRPVGIHLSLTYAKTRRPGFGCTNTGATVRRILIDHTRSTPTSIGRSKTCWKLTRLALATKRSCKRPATADGWDPG